jgi:phosphatidylinositol dimannoside acyltransferase
MSKDGVLSLDGSFWRRLARWGSSRGPEWFVRYSPPLLGLVACSIAAERRRRVRCNLRRVYGRRGKGRETVDVARTFATYASCLAEILSAGSARGRLPEAVVRGEAHLEDARRDARGVVLVTAHTAGWETVGPLLSRDHALKLMIAEAAEPSRGARAIQDDARRAYGLLVVHVGDDPLSALSLAAHLRAGGAVALQIDRAPRRIRSHGVTMFGAPARIPEGVLRLAMLTGAPLLPVFAARTGYRKYEILVHAPVRISRTAGIAELDSAAQRLANAMQDFVRAHPTQWFHFSED